MAILNYKDLNISKKNTIKSFKWGDQEIEVLTYLPIEDMYDVVMITLQKSLEDEYYNPIKLDMFYHLNLVYAFTNLVFTDEERANESKLYDEMVSSGFMTEFLNNLDEHVYTEMQENIENIAKMKMENNKSIGVAITKFIKDIPANIETMKEIVADFDPKDYQAVLDFAKAANGGRPIS